MSNKWMYNQDHSFHKGDRVRLRPGIDPSVYGEFACVGNEAIVSGLNKDKFGLPQVLVKWDQNHWAYNGVPDGWTVEDHFELVEDRMSKNDKVQDIVAMFGQALGAILNESEPEVEPEAPKAQSNNLLERFQGVIKSFDQDEPEEAQDEGSVRAITNATALISDAEAFIVVGVARHEHPGAPGGVLKPFVSGHTQSPEAEILVTAHMAQLSANAHKDMAIQLITSMGDES